MTLQNLLRIGRIKKHPVDKAEIHIDYLGEDIDESSVKKCIEETHRLQQDLSAWLVDHHPEILG